MSRLFLLFFLSPQCAPGQLAPKPASTDLAKAYTQAIGDFIKAANKKNGVRFDTLFIGKRRYGQADDFPEITLPETIENTVISLIDPEAGVKSQDSRKSRIYLNLFGWVDQEKAGFVFVAFSNGFEHQYDYNIDYKRKAKTGALELEKLEFKGPPFD